MPYTKNQFLRGLRCPKSLWLFKNKKEYIGNLGETQKIEISQTEAVLEEAKKLFNGVEIKGDFQTCLELTKQNLNNPQVKAIFNAVFFDSQIAVNVDILARNGDSWWMIFVKPSLYLKDEFIEEAAVSLYSANKDIKISKVAVMFLNSEFTKEKPVVKRFIFEDITKQSFDLQDKIKRAVFVFNQVMLRSSFDTLTIGQQCEKPQICDFRDYCFGAMPPFSIFELVDCENKSELFAKGVKTCFQYKSNDLTMLQEVQLKALNDGLVVDKDILRQFVTPDKTPINFLRFGTFSQAIPTFSKQKPFARTLYGYVLDILENGEVKQKFMVGNGKDDCRLEIIKSLFMALNNGGDIYVWQRNRTYEILNNLAIFAPQIEGALNSIKSRIKAFSDVFEIGGYYDKMFKGKFSFGNILNVIEPKIKFDELVVKSDEEAGDYYLNFVKQQENLKVELAKFLSITTLGMRVIFEEFKRKCVI